MSPSNPPDPWRRELREQADNLEHIVDDHSAREDAVLWSINQLCIGRDMDAVLQQLINSGWPAQDAAQILEEARQRSRGQRGVVTRETVKAQADARYRRAMRAGFFFGRGGLIGVALNFFVVLWDFLNAWRPRRRNGPDSNE